MVGFLPVLSFIPLPESILFSPLHLVACSLITSPRWGDLSSPSWEEGSDSPDRTWYAMVRELGRRTSPNSGLEDRDRRGRGKKGKTGRG